MGTGYLGAGPNNIEEYMGWIFELCDDTDSNNSSSEDLPSLDTVLNTQYHSMGYYELMAAFKKKSHKYDYKINDTLRPWYINFTNENYGKK